MCIYLSCNLLYCRLIIAGESQKCNMLTFEHCNSLMPHKLKTSQKQNQTDFYRFRIKIEWTKSEITNKWTNKRVFSTSLCVTSHKSSTVDLKAVWSINCEVFQVIYSEYFNMTELYSLRRLCRPSQHALVYEWVYFGLFVSKLKSFRETRSFSVLNLERSRL